MNRWSDHARKEKEKYTICPQHRANLWNKMIISIKVNIQLCDFELKLSVDRAVVSSRYHGNINLNVIQFIWRGSPFHSALMQTAPTLVAQRHWVVHIRSMCLSKKPELKISLNISSQVSYVTEPTPQTNLFFILRCVYWIRIRNILRSNLHHVVWS